MKTFSTSIVCLLISFSNVVFGQYHEPLALSKMLFGPADFPKIETYSTGEYKGRPNGHDLPTGSSTKFLLLNQTKNSALVAITVLDSLGNGLDTYLHFKKDSIWKACAFRTLAMRGILEQKLTALKQMKPQQIAENIAKYKKHKNAKSPLFKSMEEYTFSLGNTRLILEFDENIKNHFIENRAEFERLKNLALLQIKNEPSGYIKLLENEAAAYKKIFIASVSSGDYEIGGCLNFFIGGILDNSVGYIWVSDPKELPEINPSSLIMIREIGDGWYIYKTT
jgi:hypothetical protein